MKHAIRTFVAAFLAVGLALGLHSQLTPDKAAKSLELLNKMRQLDLLNHMVPLIMTKDQLNKVLLAVEKSRANVERVKLQEATEMARFETKINDALEKAMNKDQVPAKALLKELNSLITAFSIGRNVEAGNNADLVLAVIKKEFNVGQLKAASNSHDLKVYDPRLDVSKLTDDDKLKFFIKDVFLDPACYDLLIKMSKSAG